MDEKETKKAGNPGTLIHVLRGRVLELLSAEDQDEMPVRPIWASKESIGEGTESSETKVD